MRALRQIANFCGAGFFAAMALLFFAPAGQAKTISPPPQVVKAAFALYFEDVEIEPQYRPKPARHQLIKWLKKGVIRSVYLSNKKYPDWFIDANRDPSSYICGTGGCPLQIWVRGEETFYKALDTRVREARVIRPKSVFRPYLLVDFHGSQCGLSGVDACPFAFAWGDRSFGIYQGFVESARFTNSEVVRTGPLPQALDYASQLGTPAFPLQIQTLIKQQDALCQKHQGRLNTADLVNRTPDLNHDNVRDWTYDGNLAYCDYPQKDDADVVPESSELSEPAESNACEFLTCQTIVYLSQVAQNDEVSWQTGVSIGNASIDFVIGKDRFFKPVILQPLKGHESESDEPCHANNLKYCKVVPFEIKAQSKP